MVRERGSKGQNCPCSSKLGERGDAPGHITLSQSPNSNELGQKRMVPLRDPGQTDSKKKKSQNPG
jgi:hypothetical protein